MEFKYAGFWIRFLAMIIDGIILGVIGSLLFPGSGNYVTMSADGGFQMDFSANFVGPQTIIPILYTLAFWIWKGATPGKMALGLRIIEQDGSKLSWQKALLRYVGYIVSGLTLCIGYLWVGFDKKKRGFHDMIAKTYVVKK
ncbi:MAG: RDD family protein [Candidatus Gracilibacteria bacterium]|jgi:uncharacterized RDD family membrane protein YckC